KNKLTERERERERNKQQNPNDANPRRKVWKLRQMSMPSSRHLSYKPNHLSPSSPPPSPPPPLLFLSFTLLSISTLFTTTTSTAAANHEASTLYSWLHSSPSPPPSSFLSSFSDWNNLDTNPCKWTFITCTPQNLVSEINIQSIPLQLPLPSNLSSFPSLQKLIISGANLTGTISGDLGDCLGLTVIDLSSNSLIGTIPQSLSNLQNLQDLILNSNQLTGKIPPELSQCTSLKNLLLFDNRLSGPIPAELGLLSGLEVLRAGGNKDIAGKIPDELGNCRNLTLLGLADTRVSGPVPGSLGSTPEAPDTVYLHGNALRRNTAGDSLKEALPSSLASCSNLEALDLSHNSLTGSLPPGLFQLKNLTKLLLISNDISGSIPPEIGNCSSLVRLRLGNNRIANEIPKEIGGLSSLNFLDLSGNRLSGSVPDEIGSCTELQMVDISNNTLEGPLPNSLSSLSGLQVLDVSTNRFVGPIPASLGRLVSLNKLILAKNSFTGSIPPSIGLCSSLQLLDLSSNGLNGDIPVELCKIEALEIALNLSCNEFTGPIPVQISALNKLSILDISHNKLQGDLSPLSRLDNLVSLNISYNNFTGYLPDNKLFRQLSTSDLAGNQGLCSFGHDSCFLTNVAGSGIEKNESDIKRSRRLKLALALLITATIAMVIMGTIAVIRAQRTIRGDDESEMGESWPWKFTPFQKLNFSIEQVLRCLIDSNVIGKGCSGVVYRADMNNGEVIAVKKLWPTTTAAASNGCTEDKCGVRDSFSAEVKTLGSIRHKNIVRFLGCCWNRNTRLLMYDYMPNGSLGSLLHERNGNPLEWELRYQILLGAAEGLAYLHHDCVPPIVHRDIKANNILIGLEFEPYIADFGLAKLVDDGDFARSSNTVAGSYGYIAPEYGYMMKITEKSDVYSYGVVALEVLTGKQPIDPTIPEGLHVVDWVRQKRGKVVEVLAPSLLSRPESEIEEIMQALGIALLCVNSSPDERPTMKDVAAMLKEIKHEREEYAKVDVLLKGSLATATTMATATDARENKNSGGVPAPSSSSTKTMQSLYPKSNNTSFSASSLLYSSSSNAKMGGF
ncbi:hypothetical protein HYC85_012604, partial [Camellia sinensis]